MPFRPRSGPFGFLLLLAALSPLAGLAAGAASHEERFQAPAMERPPLGAAPDADVEARLRRITTALRQRPAAADGRLAFVFVNGPRLGWGNGGFRNGGWGNGGFRNGGWGNGGWRNGGWGNGGFRNGGWRNYW